MYWVERLILFIWVDCLYVLKDDLYADEMMSYMLLRWRVICWWDDDRYGDLRRVVVVLWIADVWCVDDYGELMLEINGLKAAAWKPVLFSLL